MVQVVNRELMTMKEVAELARVSSSTISRWVSSGKIPAIVLPSGQIRFVREDIEAMLTPTIASEPLDSDGQVPGQEMLL